MMMLSSILTYKVVDLARQRLVLPQDDPLARPHRQQPRPHHEVCRRLVSSSTAPGPLAAPAFVAIISGIALVLV